jgi:hypothetical protein
MNEAYCFERYGIRGIGGAMDGTHFAIAKVKPAVKMSYMNQKEGSTAILAHVVCSNIDGYALDHSAFKFHCISMLPQLTYTANRRAALLRCL